jgi:hypothetical protein
MKIDSYSNQLSQLIKLLTLIFVILLGTTSCIDEKNYNLSLAQTKQSLNQSNNSQAIATLSPSIRPLSPNFICSNVNSLRVKSWYDQKFWNSINKLNPKVIRIPGGTVANYWDWQKGGLIEDISNLPEGLPNFFIDKDSRYTASTLQDLQAGFKANDITSVFVLNMLTSDLQSQLKMLRTARDLGMAIKYIELGNEFYFATKNYRSVFADPEDYAKTATRWILAIKQEFPEAEIAVIGVGNRGKNILSRKYKWNQEISKIALPLADAITIHTYPRNGLIDQPILTKEYPYYTKENVSLILGEPFKNWQEISNNLKFIPVNKKIWVTEYNLMEKMHTEDAEKKLRVAGSWTHGMYALSMSLLFLEDPRINTICNHMLIGSSQFSSILANEKSFINPSDSNTISMPFSLSATGSALKLLSDATEGMNQAYKINFTNNQTLIGKDGLEYPALYGWMFTNTKYKKSLIINLSAQTIQVNFSELLTQIAKYNTVSGLPRDLVTKPGILQENQGTTKDYVTLPPYSVTQLSSVK